MSVRVRFAPSPTGFLHLGGARSALYNWLWARQQGGSFILRVEDTDQERNTEASVQAIFDSMRWLGLDWDEGPEVGGDHGPYFQSERLDIYQQYAQKLIDAGAAYRCYCTKDELAAARTAHKQRTGSEHGFKYPGTCRERTDAPDLPHVVRMKVPTTGSTAWEDRIKGRIEVAHDTLQDVVMMRANGVPLYNLSAAVDDLTMGVTLVGRGDDHMINTPVQILILQALGGDVPEFAHMPTILAPSGEKLSKRHAAVAVMDYAERGYLPDAVLNYLSRLGWSHGDQEIFTRDDLIAKFDWEHVGKTGAKYDEKKFIHVQASHMRLLSVADLTERALPHVQARGLEVAGDDPRLAAAMALVQARAQTLPEAADMVDYFFRDPPQLDEKAAKKFLTPEHAPRLLQLAEVVEAVEPFEREPLEQAVNAFLTDNDIPLKALAQPARVALTGRKQSPGLYEVMEVLGRERSLGRLRSAAAG